MDALGTEGQSDEEEDYAELKGVRVPGYFVHPTPWRVASMTNALAIIDKYGHDNDLLSHNGAKALPRWRKDGAGSGRVAKGLPRALYDQEWLQKLSSVQQEQLQVNDDPFEWLDVVYKA